MPASPEELTLHLRVLSGDESASGVLFGSYLNPLVDLLEAIYPDIARKDETLIEDAASDALFDYLARPQIYDAARCSFKNYLYMAARGDLLNLWRKRQQRFEREANVADIEDPFGCENETQKSVGFAHLARNQKVGMAELSVSDEASQIINRLVADDLWAQVQELVPDATERRVLALIAWGVREVEPYAVLLGIEDKPLPEQRTAVNALKEKLKTRLKRRLKVKSLGYDWD